MIRAVIISLMILWATWFVGCGSTSSFTGTCCLNGEFFDCPTEDAEDLCGLPELDPSECTRDASRDDECFDF